MDLPRNTNTVKFLEPHSLICETMTLMSGLMAASNTQWRVWKIAFPNISSFPQLKIIVDEQ